MALAMTSSSPQPPPHSHRRRRRSHPASPTPNAKSKPRAKSLPLPLLSDVGVDRDPAVIKYYARVASNLAGAGRLRDFLLAAEGLRAAAGDDPGFAARISARLLSRGVVAALRDRDLHHMLDFLRDAERVGVPAAIMLDSEASEAIGAACRVLLDERRMTQFVEIVEALTQYGFFVQGIVNPMDVLKIFVRKRDPDMAIRYARIFPHSQLLLCNTMEAFGKRKVLKHALTVFGAIKSQIGGINMFACRSIIDICGYCGSSVQARIIFEGLLADKITPNTYVFNSLMNVNAHSFSYNFSVYKHMQKLGVPPDLTTYNILLKTRCNAREFNLAQEIYEETKKKECDGLLKLDVFTYSTMMKVFADAKMWKMASNIKEDMQAAGVRLNLVTRSSLINAYANSGLVDRAIEVLEEMIRDGCQPTAPCFNIILTACVKSCQYDRAFRLFYSWKESGIKISLSPEEKVYIDDSLTFCREHPSSSGSMLVVPFRPTVTTYNILMKACGTNGERAKSVMNEMRRSGLCPDLISWSTLMNIYGSSRNRNGAIQALRRMQRIGIRLNVAAYTVAIKACVESKDLKTALHLFEEMKTHQLKPNLVTYKTLLSARSKYGSLQEVQQCLAIYHEMRKAGYEANDYYLKELIMEWCEGVLSSGNGNRDVYDLDLKHNSKASFKLLLEKVATFLQDDVDQNEIVDVRGLSKVEARIVVLSVLRKIKENYILGTLKIPFLFLTNGGGVPEHRRALELSNVLGVNISPAQVMHGHSPYRELVNRFENELIVAVGKGEPAVVMSEYGFRKVISIDEYSSYFREIDPLAPFKTWTVGQTDSNLSAKVHTSYDVYAERVKGVFVVSDPVDWGRDIQVLCDILSTGGLPGSGKGDQPPLYFAADDLEYQAAFPSERLGMGAFRIALESIYNQINDHPLKYVSYGKPNPFVFKNAARILEKLVRSMYLNSQSSNEVNDCQFSTIYMVGDNPKVDINGALKAGRPWSSILTRTGVFRGKDNDPVFPADVVVDTVEDAINYIF